MSVDWRTWSPWQSAEVREICAHMTEAERRKIARDATLYGLWVGATLAMPIQLIVLSSFSFKHLGPSLVVIASTLIGLHVACIPQWQTRVRRELCSTAWAKKRGLMPEHLRLFSFRARKLELPLNDDLK